VKRQTIVLPDDLDVRLRFEAQRRGVSVAELVREALESRYGQAASGRTLSFIGIGEGNGENASERVDEFVYGAIERHKLPTATPALREGGPPTQPKRKPVRRRAGSQ
jgi:ribbon-helix-helix CopG family protein